MRQLVSIGDRDASALLPAMLQGEQPKERNTGDVFTRGIHSKYAALVMRVVVYGKWIVCAV